MSTILTAGNATNGMTLTPDNTGTLQVKTGTGAGTTAMTLNASQNVGVGTTSPTARIHAVGQSATSADFSGRFQNSAAADLLTIRNDGGINTGLATGSPYNNTTATAANVFVNSSGTLQRSTSSIKYKIEVKNAVHGLAEVMQLRPVTYKGINNGDFVFGGLIAEEIDNIGLTEFVQYADDGSPDALSYGNMVSLAFKAIQEQQQIIKALQARVSVLEGKSS